MERLLLLVIAVLSTVLAVVLLTDAQNLPILEETAKSFQALTTLGYVMAGMALVSGFGLARMTSS